MIEPLLWFLNLGAWAYAVAGLFAAAALVAAIVGVCLLVMWLRMP